MCGEGGKRSLVLDDHAAWVGLGNQEGYRQHKEQDGPITDPDALEAERLELLAEWQKVNGTGDRCRDHPSAAGQAPRRPRGDLSSDAGRSRTRSVGRSVV